MSRIGKSLYLRLPIALTIAGSDSGGGAGVQADLKMFTALGVHGTSAITCLTAQNPRGVTGIEACSPKIVRQQIEAVFAELPPAAVKTGMLFSTEIIRTVAKFFRSQRKAQLVVDPVMVATSGARLLKPSAIAALTGALFPLATLITPNLDETEVLLGRKPRTVEQMRAAAQVLWLRFGCAVLVKGGHLRGSRAAVDIFFDGQTELLLTAPFIRGLHLHGTGCTYSAAIAAHLALGCELPEAVTRAKESVTRAIANSRKIGAHTVLVPA
jgi:hydroxymethylpyrimidine/phosphomethylpyrimidine kinase